MAALAQSDTTFAQLPHAFGQVTQQVSVGLKVMEQVAEFVNELAAEERSFAVKRKKLVVKYMTVLVKAQSEGPDAMKSTFASVNQLFEVVSAESEAHSQFAEQLDSQVYPSLSEAVRVSGKVRDNILLTESENASLVRQQRKMVRKYRDRALKEAASSSKRAESSQQEPPSDSDGSSKLSLRQRLGRSVSGVKQKLAEGSTDPDKLQRKADVATDRFEHSVDKLNTLYRNYMLTTVPEALRKLESVEEQRIVTMKREMAKLCRAFSMFLEGERVVLDELGRVVESIDQVADIEGFVSSLLEKHGPAPAIASMPKLLHKPESEQAQGSRSSVKDRIRGVSIGKAVQVVKRGIQSFSPAAASDDAPETPPDDRPPSPTIAVDMAGDDTGADMATTPPIPDPVSAKLEGSLDSPAPLSPPDSLPAADLIGDTAPTDQGSAFDSASPTTGPVALEDLMGADHLDPEIASPTATSVAQAMISGLRRLAPPSAPRRDSLLDLDTASEVPDDAQSVALSEMESVVTAGAPPKRRRGTRQEKAVRKLFRKLGIQRVPDVYRAVIKKSGGMYFVFQDPDVYRMRIRLNGLPTYVIFGEADLPNLEELYARLSAAGFEDPVRPALSASPSANQDRRVRKQERRLRAARTVSSILSGAPDEPDASDGEELDHDEFDNEDVEMVMEQADTSRAAARAALVQQEGDVVAAILSLS